MLTTADIRVARFELTMDVRVGVWTTRFTFNDLKEMCNARFEPTMNATCNKSESNSDMPTPSSLKIIKKKSDTTCCAIMLWCYRLIVEPNNYTISENPSIYLVNVMYLCSAQYLMVNS
ncbi:uncharacterized protein PRCAT00005349001 [Priceomyces carsonii]|uniref:uncharacterized protein n=1 Tax=Priceomyces carsonii TaxID=28549 RepID=UPI002ED7FF97|nr:unnamed protein product [Priceomyces carsonii]